MLAKQTVQRGCEGNIGDFFVSGILFICFLFFVRLFTPIDSERRGRSGRGGVGGRLSGLVGGLVLSGRGIGCCQRIKVINIY